MSNTPMTDREAAQDYLFGHVEDAIKTYRRRAELTPDPEAARLYKASADELQDIIDHFVLIKYEEWERMQR